MYDEIVNKLKANIAELGTYPAIDDDDQEEWLERRDEILEAFLDEIEGG